MLALVQAFLIPDFLILLLQILHFSLFFSIYELLQPQKYIRLILGIQLLHPVFVQIQSLPSLIMIILFQLPQSLNIDICMLLLDDVQHIDMSLK